ncbi:MAG: T9SS type B sorting domain-containing protein, partial [Bacteroidetes bacterium]|nr:T9SS type B sorting domain-containing protein [Bacteroidota bacterium]
VNVDHTFAAAVTPLSATACQGGSATFTASGGSSYKWNTGETTETITVNPTDTTIYTVTVSGASGCSATLDAVANFVVIPVEAGSDQSICIGKSAILSASGGDAYNWSNNSNTQSTIVSPVITSTYIVTVSDAITNCFATDSVQVTVNLPPGVQFSMDVSDGCQPLIVAFNDESPSLLSAWSWDFGDPQSGIDNISSEQNPTHIFSSSQIFTVTLKAASTEGCIDSISHEIIPTFTFYAPNTFTPDGDQINDYFMPNGVCWDNSSFSMEIFDRWGKDIYSTTDVSKPWDGRIKGKSEIYNQGVYIWVVNVKDLLGKQYEYRGIVTITL